MKTNMKIALQAMLVGLFGMSALVKADDESGLTGGGRYDQWTLIKTTEATVFWSSSSARSVIEFKLSTGNPQHYVAAYDTAPVGNVTPAGLEIDRVTFNIPHIATGTETNPQLQNQNITFGNGLRPRYGLHIRMVGGTAGQNEVMIRTRK